MPHKLYDFIETAQLKLINGVKFDADNSDHVLAVLSQRLSIDLVLAASEVMELADQSVAHHMRLLTSILLQPWMTYTCSPSEPILAIAAARFLSTSHDVWADVLNTFNRYLCRLVEKGLNGELAARTLLLIAHDFALQTRKPAAWPDVLTPVPVLLFFDTLFGNGDWYNPHRESFKTSFGDAYINFTHWIITKDTISATSDP